MEKIKFKNIKKSYDNINYVLDDINFEINKGDFVTIIGESGGGKTTLLKLIAGLEKVTTGEIFIDGEYANYLSPKERNVAFIFQDFTLYPSMTVFENIIFPLKKEKIPYDKACEMTWEIIKKMNLEVIQAELPRVLSYGQCQKVALAKALLRHPQIMLFDEPLSNIDEPSKLEYKKMIIETKELYPDITFVYVTHNIADSLLLGNKLMIIDSGKLIDYGKPNYVYQFPKNELSCQYLHGDASFKEGVFDENIILTDFQKTSNLKVRKDNVRIYYDDKWCSVFNEKEEAILGLNRTLVFDVVVNDKYINLANNLIPLNDLVEGILETGNLKLILYSSLFTSNQINNSFKVVGKVNYVDKEFICFDFNNESIPMEKFKEVKIGDDIEVYYPLDKIRLMNNEGNYVLSSYLLSKNIIKTKVLNSKTGLIKFCGKKIKVESAVGRSKEIEIKLPMDAFICTNNKNDFQCVEFYNEEDMGNYYLQHIELKGYDEYFSIKVTNKRSSFDKKIYYHIDFSKGQIL